MGQFQQSSQRCSELRKSCAVVTPLNGYPSDHINLVIQLHQWLFEAFASLVSAPVRFCIIRNFIS